MTTKPKCRWADVQGILPPGEDYADLAWRRWTAGDTLEEIRRKLLDLCETKYPVNLSKMPTRDLARGLGMDVRPEVGNTTGAIGHSLHEIAGALGAGGVR